MNEQTEVKEYLYTGDFVLKETYTARTLFIQINEAVNTLPASSCMGIHVLKKEKPEEIARRIKIRFRTDLNTEGLDLHDLFKEALLKKCTDVEKIIPGDRINEVKGAFV